MKSFVLGLSLVLVSAGPAWSQTGAGDGPWLIPPVDAAISRHFEPPESHYGAGHRGVDYAVLPGTAVRAAGAGTVTFAGRVGGAYAVTLAHPDGMETTYSQLAAIHVEEGRVVGRGTWIGRSGSSHPNSGGGLHFAVKVHGRYVDPIDYLGALDVTEAIHLAPIPDPRTVSGSLQAAFEAAAVGFEPCINPQGAGPIPASAPNGNVVVAIAGISSKTTGGSNPRIFEVPEALGYPPDRMYRFSYRGLSGTRWHEPYEYADTNGDLVHQAERLALLLQIVAHEHPGADIDIGRPLPGRHHRPHVPRGNGGFVDRGHASCRASHHLRHTALRLFDRAPRRRPQVGIPHGRPPRQRRVVLGRAWRSNPGPRLSGGPAAEDGL